MVLVGPVELHQPFWFKLANIPAFVLAESDHVQSPQTPEPDLHNLDHCTALTRPPSQCNQHGPVAC